MSPILKDFLKYAVDLKQRKEVTYYPEWKSEVERWYQLDENSYALCEAIAFWKKTNCLKEFEQIIFINKGVSQLADADFVRGMQENGSPSPAKFVYTLPNIASSICSQVLKWNGPIFCLCPVDIQQSVKFGINLAQSQLRLKNTKSFILYLSPSLNDQQDRDVYGLFIH